MPVKKKSAGKASLMSFPQAKRVGNPSENKKRFRTSRNDNNSAVKKKTVEAVKTPAKKISDEELLVANLTSMGITIEQLANTIALLTTKLEGMAHHIIAYESVIGALVKKNDLDFSAINDSISARIAAGTDGKGDPANSLGIAAKFFTNN